jgi:cell division control protein 6
MNLFENAGSSIFRDMTYFEDDYLPSRLIGRDDQIKSIADAYYPILMKDTPRNLFLHGEPGTGKNVTNAYVINELRETIKKRKLGIDVIHLRVSCPEAETSNAVLRQLVEKAELGTRLPKRGCGFDDHVDHFRSIFSDNSHRLIIIELDEIDRLKDNKLLYTLSRAHDTGLLQKNTKISIVGTSNDSTYNGLIDSAVSSSLNMKPIFFGLYNKEQLTNILNDRRDAFSEGIVSDYVIDACCILSVLEHGDARRTIQLLKQAGYIAYRKDALEVDPSDVHEANKKEDYNLRHILEGLPRQQKAVLMAVVKLSANRKESARKNDDPIRLDQVTPVYYKVCDEYMVIPVKELSVLDLLKRLESNRVIYLRKDNRGKRNGLIIGLNKELGAKVFGVEALLNSLLELS